MKETYVYFVSFNFPGGSGNIDVSTKGKLDRMEDILSIQKLLSKQEGVEICIDNFKLLRIDEPKQ